MIKKGMSPVLADGLILPYNSDILFKIRHNK